MLAIEAQTQLQSGSGALLLGSARPSELAQGEQRAEVKALGGKILPAAGLALNYAHHHYFLRAV